MAIQKQIQTSSASKEKVIIEDLRPRHTTKLIHVKVHSWIQNIQLSAEAMEFILADENEFEVKKHVNSLNKPVVKSVQTPDGDITDCVPTTERPAFDHHFLKEGMIQMKHITVQFPKSTEPDLINQGGHQLIWKGISTMELKQL
ncbi:hypothetical protein Rs2_16192 [Raphanus sativus]|nr:hypothetical protein Rs2_16192 [Raphanus sativus]